ncbi:MAG: YigZ family protein [Anaerolineae bacterium]|nr:YigZ family protein [Anaerolineae bacterium]
MTSSETRYPIPAKTIRVELRIVNSRFIATIGEARTVDEAKAFIDAIREEFHDATHNVHVFRVGYGGSVTEGMTDDGEPPGTAGRPALAVLRGADLGDVVLVITRYFGGTKLGTGGLVRAYTESAQEALAALPRDVRIEKRWGTIVLPYSLYEPVKRLVDSQGGEIGEEAFGAEVTIEVIFPVDRIDGFEDALGEISAGRVVVEWAAG